jgi:hypothetical protein
VSSEVAPKQLAEPIRRAPATTRPSRRTDLRVLSHAVVDPGLRAVPVTKELLQSREPPELEPESEATADRRGIGREVLHSAIDQVLGRLELQFPAYVDRPESDRWRGEPSHGSGAVGEEPIPVSRQIHARTLARTRRRSHTSVPRTLDPEEAHRGHEQDREKDAHGRFALGQLGSWTRPESLK